MDGRAGRAWRRVRRLGVASLLAILAAAGCARLPENRQSTPRRIIAVAPNIVEILYALDLGDRVVGVGDYCSWPPEAAEKPKIGGLIDPRLEVIVGLEADLAILLASEQSLARSLERLGIEVLVAPVETVDDVARAMMLIGERTDRQRQARKAVEALQRGVAPRAASNGESRRVLLVIGRRPGSLSEIFAAAGDTFLDELAARAGAANVLGDSPVRYPQVGLEEILLRAPEVIVELQPDELSRAVRSRLLEDWRSAIPESSPCVAVIEGAHVLVPGPRLPQLYEDLVAALAGCGEGDG